MVVPHSTAKEYVYSTKKSKICREILSCIVFMSMMSLALVVLLKIVKKFEKYETDVMFRFGGLDSGDAEGLGIFFILPCIDSCPRVDLHIRTYDVPPQEVITKDSLDAVADYRVRDVTISIADVEDAHHSTKLLVQTTFRNTVGTRPLHEILSERETISGNMQISLDEASEAWNIKVEHVEIKDVRPPAQQQRAEPVAAEGEQQRFLQTLNSISAEKNSSIEFPLPADFLTNFFKAKERSS